MDKLHYVAKGLLLYETLDSEQFMQAFNEELSLDEKDVFAKKEESKVVIDIEEDIQEESNEEEKNNLNNSKLDEFKLPEDDNK